MHLFEGKNTVLHQKRKSVTRRGTAQIVLACATLAILALSSTAPASAAPDGDITSHGGATRVQENHVENLQKSLAEGSAKNVILIIGDGMGDSEITAARNYIHGAAGTFPGIDALPLTGQYTTYSLNKKTGAPNYVPDSAATGTAWATGTKSYNGAISVDVNGAAQKTLLQIAKDNGLKTGNITTTAIQDATPAVQVANVTSRSCFGPEATSKKCPENALENGGKGSISEQLLQTRPDVSMGGGSESFDEEAKGGTYAGKSLLEQAGERGFNVVTDLAGMNGINSASTDAPVLGLFTPGNMPVRWEGPLATHTGGAEAPVSCTDNPARTANLPTLKDMTAKSIELLKDGKKGFFLQVESGSIDKQNHAANPCGQIGETLDLDESVKTAMDFAVADGNTMVIVTADHAHTSQIIAAGKNTPGLTRSLTTLDGETMTMSYGTAEEGKSQGHTGSQVRIAGYGPGSVRVIGFTDQTDVFFTVSNALQLDPAATLPTPTPSPTAAPTTSETPRPTAPNTKDPSEGAGVIVPGDKDNGAAPGISSGSNPLAVTGASVTLWILIAMALLTGGFFLRRRSVGLSPAGH